MSTIDFDPEAIRSLATILREADLTEIEITEADRRIRVVRAAPALAASHQHATVSVPAAQPSAAPVAAPAPHADDTPPVGAVTSPMVGVAYLSPDPGSPPFVSIGSAVTAGQTILLIEAMKTFNQIKAPHAGIVTQILVASGQPVEFGQPLLVIA